VSAAALVLVTGGAGYIRSHAVEALPQSAMDARCWREAHPDGYGKADV
jgi:UDP-glucose 4-epimerase